MVENGSFAFVLKMDQEHKDRATDRGEFPQHLLHAALKFATRKFSQIRTIDGSAAILRSKVTVLPIGPALKISSVADMKLL